MTGTEKLKKFIQEEVRRAVKQEMSKLLKEGATPEADFRSSLEREVKTKVSPKKQPAPMFSNNNPIGQILNETAMSFSTNDVHSFTNTGMMSPMDVMQPQRVNTGTVNDMIATARPSSNLDMVQIDTVPDFSALMNKMKQRGDI